jgi:hypothetical protein
LLKPLTPALKPIKSVFDFLILWAFHIGDENHIRHRPYSWYIHLHLPFFSIWDLRSNRRTSNTSEIMRCYGSDYEEH